MAGLFIFCGDRDLFSSQEIPGILSWRSLPQEGQRLLRARCTGKAEGSEDAIICRHTVCWILDAHLIHECLERNKIDFVWREGVLIYREENLNSGDLDSLSKATQLVKDIDGHETLLCMGSRACTQVGRCRARSRSFSADQNVMHLPDGTEKSCQE